MATTQEHTGLNDLIARIEALRMRIALLEKNR